MPASVQPNTAEDSPLQPSTAKYSTHFIHFWGQIFYWGHFINFLGQTIYWEHLINFINYILSTNKVCKKVFETLPTPAKNFKA